jgi:predicted dehydrogenase
MSKVKLGVIGLGNIGRAHCKNIIEGKCPEIELVAVADTNSSRLNWLDENHQESVVRFEDADAMMDSGLVDAILVAIPHYYHAEYAMKAMKKGLHVMVEKPAGVYTKQVREMNEVAKNSDVVFGMMFNQRTNHIYRKAKELVSSGKYGNLRRVTWLITNWYRPQAYYDSGDWRATWSGEGGGVLLNQCPHQLDLLQWICGMPVRVHAFLKYGQWHNIEVEDDVTAYMEFENGATGCFITTTGDVNGSNRLEIQLDKAKIVIDKTDLSVWEFEMSEPEFSRTSKAPFGGPKFELMEIETDGKDEEHSGVMNAFAGAILRGEDLVARGEEGINGLMLSNAMHLSSFLGKTIELPFDEDLYYEELQKRVATSVRKVGGNDVVADTSGTY